MSNLINLIYASSAVSEMPNDDLLQLLTQAREKNSRLDITGMLLYKGGNFLQVLEGDRQVVEDLYLVIEKDPRHHQSVIILKRPVTERSFSEWSMGFLQLDNIDPATVPGYTPFLNYSFSSEKFKDENFAYTFLRVFKKNLR
ncbi:MAG: BLUF domain-containing protein [Chloroflexota bacterium]